MYCISAIKCDDRYRYFYEIKIEKLYNTGTAVREKNLSRIYWIILFYLYSRDRDKSVLTPFYIILNTEENWTFRFSLLPSSSFLVQVIQVEFATK